MSATTLRLRSGQALLFHTLSRVRRARKMDKSSFHARDVQRRFLHAPSREGHFGNRAQALVRGQGLPFAQFRVLLFVEAGVGHDSFVHQLDCGTGDGGLQPGQEKADPPPAVAGEG